jgi:hypothetical protein
MMQTITPSRSRFFTRAVLGAVAVAAALFLGVLGGAGAASAHGGPFQLTVSPDGAGGLIVSAAYTEDGHAVSEIIDPVATAVAPDGTTAGPVSLISSAEGEGIWVTPEPFLPSGQWAVTVSTTTPSSATTSIDVTVAELAPPVEPGETVAPVADDAGGADGPADASGASADEGGMSPLTVGLWIAAGVVVVAVAGGLVYRNRARIFGRR